MTAVAYHAHFLPQKSICPMSQTSRTSGWRRQNSQSTSDLLNVSDNGNFGEFFYLEMVVNSRVKHYKCNEHSKDEPVVSKVLAQVIEFRAWSRGGMSEATYPGTSPSMLYDQGKLMMARQIYSEKSSAAVCKWKQTRQHFNEKRVGMVEQKSQGRLLTFCQLHVRYWMPAFASLSICFCTSSEPASESDSTEGTTTEVMRGPMVTPGPPNHCRKSRSGVRS